MVLRQAIHDREHDKFVECDDGSTAVLTKLCDAIINAIPSGLQTAGKFTEVQLSAGTWTALPPTPLTDRNGLAIQNQSGTEIKLNFDNGVGTYSGAKVPANSERFYNITDAIIVYAKPLSGSPTIGIEEIS